MSIPNIIQSYDSFNTWFDATNNLISHIANVDNYLVLNSPIASTGNATLNGSMSVWSLSVVANVSGNTIFSVNGTAALVNTTLQIVGAASFQNTISVTGAVALAGALSVNGAVSISNTFSISNSTATHLSVNGTHTNIATTLSVTKLGTFLNAIAITGNVTASNSTATVFHLNSSALSVNTTLHVVGTTTLSNAVSVLGPFVSNALMELGGPYHINSVFVNEIDLGGEGVEPDLTLPINSMFLRLANVTSTTKQVSGIVAANTSAFRIATIFNASNNDVTFLHNSSSGSPSATDKILTPDERNFVLTTGAAMTIFYDVSVTNWRIVGTSSQVYANTSTAGVVSTDAQSFAGDKTFTGNISFTGAKVVLSNTTGFVLPVGADMYAT